VGIGQSGPASKLDIKGGLTIGSNYSGTNQAPSNGALIEGSVGIGTTSPKQKADINGKMLIRNGSSKNSAQSQILFGYNGGNNYKHAIKTRHNGGAGTNNAIDFYVWDYGTDGQNAEPTKRVMTVGGGGSGRVGIGNASPGSTLDVAGDIQLNNGTSVHTIATNTSLGNSDNTVPTQRAVNQYIENAAGNQLSFDTNNDQFNIGEGSGSGLNADQLDGKDGSHYLDNTDNQTLSISGSDISISNGNTATLDYGSSSTGGPRPVGNFGQFQSHGKYQNFNTPPDHWGWNYVQDDQNAPNSNSGQWYRGVFSLGSGYPARGSGNGHSLELAFPRYNHASAGVWMRTVENGTIGNWTRIDANHITGDNLGNHTATTDLDMNGHSIDNLDAVRFDGDNDRRIYGQQASGSDIVSVDANYSELDIMGRVIEWGGSNLHIGEDGGWGNNHDHSEDEIEMGRGVGLLELQDTTGPVMHITEGHVGIQERYPSYALDVNGRINSSGITETSDKRLKENITNINGALKTVTQLNGVYYDWKQNEYPERNLEGGRQVGVVAQQIEKHLPEVVDTDNEGYKSVEYSHMVPVLIEAVKEQTEIIEEKEKQIQQLKEDQQAYRQQTQKQIEALAERVDELEEDRSSASASH